MFENPAKLESPPLYVYGTSWRSRPISESLAAAERARGFAGVSRVARIDGLTGLPFPVHSMARPLAQVAVTLCTGKWTTEQESRASGLFEAIEVACAESTLAILYASEKELCEGTSDFVSVNNLCADAVSHPIGWVNGINYENGANVLLPECAVSMVPF